MKKKLVLHTWNYFKKHHHIDEDGIVWKNPNAKKKSFLNKIIVDKRVYDTEYSYPGPYTINIEEPSNPWENHTDRRVISWMIDEVMNEETHPEYFI